MKKIIFTLFLASLLPLATYAQKAKGKTISFTYMQSPSSPLEGSFKTYSINIKDRYSNLINMGLTEKKIADTYFDFKKYEKVGSKGDFQLALELGEGVVLDEELKSETKTVGKGDKAKKVKYYHYEVGYNLPIAYQLKDGRREVMRDGMMNGRKVFKTKENTSKAVVMKNWLSSKKSTMRKKYTSYVSGRLGELSKELYSEIDQRPRKVTTNFFRIKKAEKYKAEQYTEAFDLSKKVLEAATAETPLSELQEKMVPAEKIWLAGLEKYKPKDKKQRGMFFSSAFNLGKMYILLGDFEKAKAMIERSKETEKKSGQIRQLESLLAEFEQRKEANIDIPQTYVGTYESGEETDDNEDSMAAPAIRDYVITTSNDTIIGDLKVERSVFGVSKIIVTNDFDASQSVKDFNASKIKEIRKGTSSYHLLKLPKSDKLNSPLLEMAKIVYVTDKAGIYTKGRADGEKELFFMRFNHSKAVNLAGIKFLSFNKGISKYFSDCKTVVAKAKEKAYKRTEASLIQVIDDYTACK